MILLDFMTLRTLGTCAPRVFDIWLRGHENVATKTIRSVDKIIHS